LNDHALTGANLRKETKMSEHLPFMATINMMLLLTVYAIARGAVTLLT